jgi:protein arginine kinase activator
MMLAFPAWIRVFPDYATPKLLTKMKCDICDNKATVFLTQIVDGEMKKVNLCHACAEKNQVSDPTSFGLTDLFPESGTMEKILDITGDLRCPECGFTRENLQKTARFGCPACYQTFRTGLEMNLPAMHRNATRHMGKVPRRLARRLLIQRAEQFKKDLDTAIEKENFEEAARLRDQIRACETLWQEAPSETPEAALSPTSGDNQP